jgi:two-component system sensor histidine kinase HydH
VLSGIAGALFAWRLSVPIRRLTAAVKGITARGRPEPIGEPVAGGEVGVLTEAFNTMMERLALAEREAVAQSRLALLGEVAASIVHDVRTPLSVLKTSAQLLAGAGELSAAERRDLAALVASEVDRLNRVVTHLADLGRPRPTLRARRSVAELVERTVSVLRPWARARGVAIETQGDAATSIVADTDQVLQALLNLVHNAVQASPAGGRVTIRWEPTPAGAAIDVTDTGPGFTAEALERACAPFFTTKADGTGLGLAIVKRIVEAHDGTVTVRNVPGTGAGVRLELPSAAA